MARPCAPAQIRNAGIPFRARQHVARNAPAVLGVYLLLTRGTATRAPTSCARAKGGHDLARTSDRLFDEPRLPACSVMLLQHCARRRADARESSCCSSNKTAPGTGAIARGRALEAPPARRAGPVPGTGGDARMPPRSTRHRLVGAGSTASWRDGAVAGRRAQRASRWRWPMAPMPGSPSTPRGIRRATLLPASGDPGRPARRLTATTRLRPSLAPSSPADTERRYLTRRLRNRPRCLSRPQQGAEDEHSANRANWDDRTAIHARRSSTTFIWLAARAAAPRDRRVATSAAACSSSATSGSRRGGRLAPTSRVDPRPAAIAAINARAVSKPGAVRVRQRFDAAEASRQCSAWPT
jgi:hypothetical protein